MTNASAPAVAAICHRLDGLPLALELAAARIRMLPPEAMLRRLDHRLPLLTGGARDLPARQQTLRGAIAWSHELLESDEQALFRRLGVFAGGAMLDAIEAVAASDELGIDVFTGVESLVDHSLVRQTEAGGEPRFGMLETLREYALEQLATTGDADEAHRRHAAYYLALTAMAAPQLTGPEQAHWLTRLETEHENLRAALDWTAVHDPDTALRMAANLWRFWYSRGHLSEGRVRLQQVLAANQKSGSAERAAVLHGAAVLASVQGDVVDAKSMANESLQICKLRDDPYGMANAYNTLADCESTGENQIILRL